MLQTPPTTTIDDDRMRQVDGQIEHEMGFHIPLMLVVSTGGVAADHHDRAVDQVTF
jgi:hypothetical protein